MWLCQAWWDFLLCFGFLVFFQGWNLWSCSTRLPQNNRGTTGSCRWSSSLFPQKWWSGSHCAYQTFSMRRMEESTETLWKTKQMLKLIANSGKMPSQASKQASKKPANSLWGPKKFPPNTIHQGQLRAQLRGQTMRLSACLAGAAAAVRSGGERCGQNAAGSWCGARPGARPAPRRARGARRGCHTRCSAQHPSSGAGAK